ncbi:hypothetical protein HDV02_003241 [Globomyces sp. JEL0801]|nr:hypothetical protein HDV02_003241 [Globomyces sp. JEL0801]
MLFMENLFSITLKTLEDTKNDRLWTKTNLKLAKLWLDKEEYGRLKKIIRTLHESCKNVDGSSDQQKGTLLLEIYALEIQLYTTTKNNKKLKEVYQQCLIVKSAIPHPRIMGLIRECGGKMHMYEKEWEKAQTDFFEAFKNYDEAGSPQRIQCLRYLVLANMLMESQINPFDSQETKPYAGDPQIVMLTNLVEAFQSKDIKRFETILRQNHSSIMNDSFIREYIDDVLKNIRMQVVQKLAKPYTRIKLSFISEQLNITPEIAEDLLISLILDGRVKGKIDQINQIVELEQDMPIVMTNILGVTLVTISIMVQVSIQIHINLKGKLKPMGLYVSDSKQYLKKGKWIFSIMLFAEDQLTTLQNIVRVTSLIGFSGAILVFVYLIRFPRLFNNPVGRIVIALACTDAIDASFKFLARAGINSGSDSALCQIQAFVLHVECQAQLLLGLSLGLNIVYILYLKGDAQTIQKYEWGIIFLSFSIPLPYAVYQLFNPHLVGDGDLWCFTSAEYGNLRFWTFYFWLILIFMLNVLFIILTSIGIRRLYQNLRNLGASESSSKGIKVVLYRLAIYLIGFFIAWLPSFLNRTIPHPHANYEFAMAQAIVSPTRGMINFLAFWLSMRKSEEVVVDETTSTSQKGLPYS